MVNTWGHIMSNSMLPILSLAFLSFAPSLAIAIEAPLQCSGTVTFSASFVDMSCINGACTGWIPAQYVRIKGTCDSEKEIFYTAEGVFTPIYVTGTCNEGVLTSNSLSQNIAIYGECSFEDNYYGSYYSSTYSPSSFATGFCQSTGMSRIFFEGVTRPIKGLCRQNSINLPNQ